MERLHSVSAAGRRRSVGRGVGRRGYTLTETTAVLAVVVTMLALAVPALLKPVARAELRDAAKQVQHALAQAREEAIETGRVHQFRFEPGGRYFEVGPRIADGPEIAGIDGLWGGATDLPYGGWRRGDDYAAVNGLEPILEELPAGAWFAAASSDLLGSDDGQSVVAVAGAAEASGEWSDPIVFYPNGRTSNARIRVFGPGERHVDIVVRGLTGDAMVGEPVEPEVPRL